MDCRELQAIKPACARNTWQSQETRAAGKTRLGQAEVVREVVSQKAK